jgi:hypothetical protein
VKTLRLSAALAALTLTASTTCAAVIDLSNALGPSGGYYHDMFGGQPMTAAQQAYADQEDQLRLLGFLSDLGGDIALGQIFYHIAYGIISPPPPSALDLASGGSDLPSALASGGSDLPSALDLAGAGSDLPSALDFASGGSDLRPPSMTPSGLVTGASAAFLTLLTGTTTGAGIGLAIAVPEASTWAMMLVGFGGLCFAGYRSTGRGVAVTLRA